MSNIQNKPNDYLRCIHRGKNTGTRLGGWRHKESEFECQIHETAINVKVPCSRGQSLPEGICALCQEMTIPGTKKAEAYLKYLNELGKADNKGDE